MAKRSTKKTTKKKAAKKAVKKALPKMTKAEIITALSKNTGLSQKEVRSVFVELDKLIKTHIAEGGSGEFTVPDIGIKIKRAMKGPRKERKGRNPATGEVMTIPAKPATVTVKVLALKSLRDVVEKES